MAKREFELEGKVEEVQMEQVMELGVASGRFSFCNTVKTRNAPFTPLFCVRNQLPWQLTMAIITKEQIF